MIVLLPVSHVAATSRVVPKMAIDALKPEIVAVELCPARLALLDKLKKKRQTPRISLSDLKTSALAYIMFKMQQYYGQKTGQTPGEEFLEAANAARKAGAVIIPIDRDIRTTLRRLSGTISFATIFKLLKNVFFGAQTEFDISRVPGEKTVNKIIREFKREFPEQYGVLVEERNEYMARMIESLPTDKKILVVVGAGHVPGLRKRLKYSRVFDTHFFKHLKRWKEHEKNV